MKRIALVLAVVLVPLSVVAGTTGSLTGNIVSTLDGVPIANAVVTARSSTQIESTRSDSHGSFSFVSLTPNIYSISVERAGYQPVLIPEISIFADTSLHITPRMVAASVYITHVDRLNKVLRPGITSDVYSYNAPATSLFPPTRNNQWILVMTPGITFGRAASAMH